MQMEYKDNERKSIEIHYVNVPLEEWKEEQNAWNDRSNYFVGMHTRDDRRAQVVEFMEFIKKEGLLPFEVDGAGQEEKLEKGTTGKCVKRDIHVLDIGCGVGDYALGFACEGYSVTGIDLSTGMIEGAKQLAESYEVPLNLYVGPWSEETRQILQWNKQYDLVYSIFCPIMFEPENIEAMAKTSKGKCLWIAFDKRIDETVDRLADHFFGGDGFPWKDSMKECLETIHRIGDNVKIVYKTTPETEKKTLDEAVEYFALRLHRDSWGPMEEMQSEIRELLTPYVQEDGYIYNKTEDTVAWVSWDVK